MDITERLLGSHSQKIKCAAFHEFCTLDFNSIYFANLLLDPLIKENINSSILSSGLMGSLEKNKEEYISFIWKYIDKSIISLDVNNEQNFKDLQIMFNSFTTFNRPELAKKIDDKFLILENALVNPMPNSIILKPNPFQIIAEINDDGSLSISQLVSQGRPKPKQLKHTKDRDNFSLNPILFNLKLFNPKMLDSLFNSGYEIHPSIIKYAVISSIYYENNDALSYLFSNQKCIDVIKNCEHIKEFINSKRYLPDSKEEAKIHLFKLMLQEELPNRNPSRNRPKI